MKSLVHSDNITIFSVHEGGQALKKQYIQYLSGNFNQQKSLMKEETEETRNFRESKEEGRKVWAALSSQMGEGAGFFGAMFDSFIRFLRKNMLSFFLFGLAFGIAGGIYGILRKETVLAEMTVSYAQLEKKIYADMLFKLEQLRGNGQYATLAAVLGLTEAQAQTIRKIDSKNIHKEPLVKDVSTQKVPFYIEVEVYDETVLPALQKALVEYINEPPFVKERIKMNETNYRNELRLLEQQLVYMDSLKSMLLKNLKTPDAEAVASLNNLNKNQNEIFGRMRDLQGALQFNRNIEVMDGFVGHSIPLAQRCIPLFLIGFAIGLGVRMVWLLFR